MTGAAWIAVVLLTVVAIFQLALAFGVPWGRAAWGGANDGVLPGRLRLASAITGLVVYPALGLFILDSAEVIDTSMPGGPFGMWILAVLFAIGAVMNLASRSKLERLWGPVSAAIAACCAVVAVGL